VKTNNLIEQFKEVAEIVDSTVRVIEKFPETLYKALLEITSEDGDIILAEPDDLNPGLFDLFRKSEKVITDPSDQQMAKAKFGVTDAFAAVARTGSVCVSMTEKMGGSFSLFAGVHIAVVEAWSIVARPADIFNQQPFREKAFSRDFVFISGSSATADMGPLVRGVHGPANLHVIILL